ncbi:hypothetical protein ACLOJK_013034 [Asimina triloba]
MATEAEELIGFLSSPSPQLKKAAVDIVRGLTGSEDGSKSLSAHSEIALPALSRLLGENKMDKDSICAMFQEISEPAAEALINLSQNSDISEKMISMGVVKTVMEILYKQECTIKRLLVMLLVNLTQSDSGVASLLQNAPIKTSSSEAAAMVDMAFVSVGTIPNHDVSFFFSVEHDADDDPFEHVASILVNISKMEAGRSILLDPKRGLLKQIIPQFDSTSLLRKKGVSGAIRNCCFEAENQLPYLLLISEFLWPALLLPVAGKKAYSEQDVSKMPPELGSALSHEREPVDDPGIRVQALEAIYLIALQEAGRKALWSVNGTRILQVGYEDEEDPKVMEAYEQVGSLQFVPN